MTVASQQALAQILTHWRFLIVPESLITSRRPNRLGQKSGLSGGVGCLEDDAVFSSAAAVV
jgi:hypothetical protein